MTATIIDVAKQAGVSTATVSRVINNDHSVKSANVKKVLDAIDACNYVPNRVARNLKIDKSQSIGFLVSDISNSYFMTMAKIISDYLQSEGYELIICSTDEDPVKEINHLNRFISNHVDGIILNTTNKNDDYIAELSQNVPIVLIERQIRSDKFIGDFVGANNFGGISLMTDYLIRLGHRKIGFINSELSVNTGAERMAGFAYAMEKVGITVDRSYKYLSESKYFNYEGGYVGAQYLTALNDMPTAIIASNNTLALGALSFLKTFNFKIPSDISFCSYGDIENSSLLFVNPTYSSLNPSFSGKNSASFIMSRISNHNLANREAIFDSQLIVGDSTGILK